MKLKGKKIMVIKTIEFKSYKTKNKEEEDPK